MHLQFEFEHAGDVIDRMLNLMSIADEEARQKRLREQHVLPLEDEDFLRHRRHRREREQKAQDHLLTLKRKIMGKAWSKLQKDAVSSTSWGTDIANKHKKQELSSSQETPKPSDYPSKQEKLQHDQEAESKDVPGSNASGRLRSQEEHATLSQPRDESFVQQHPRRLNLNMKKLQTLIIARDDLRPARLPKRLESRRHAAIVPSRPGSAVHPAFRDQPPTPPITPEDLRFPDIPTSRASLGMQIADSVAQSSFQPPQL